MSIYRMYIDESGTNSSKNYEGMNKYLTLAGVIIKKEDYLLITHELNLLKNKIFNFDLDTKNIILHKEDIYKAKNGFEFLRDPEKRKFFDEQLLNFLNKIPFTIIAVTINKTTRCKRYGPYICDHYEITLETLLKRYVMFLDGNNSFGDVLIEARDKGQDKAIRKRYRSIYYYGTKKRKNIIDMPADRFQKRLSSNEIKLKPKRDNITGLQIADVIVSPMRNYILNKYENIEHKKSYSLKIFNAIKNKIRTNKRGTIIEGYGIVYIN